MFEHAQRSGSRQFSMQVLAPVVSHTEARRCCERPSWIRRHRDPGGIVGLEVAVLRGERCTSREVYGSARCHFGDNVTTISVRDLFKDAAKQTGALSCLFSGYQNPKYKADVTRTHWVLCRSDKGYAFSRASKANKIQRCDRNNVTEVSSGAVFVFLRY